MCEIGIPVPVTRGEVQYEGESNENLKFIIKNRNIAQLHKLAEKYNCLLDRTNVNFAK
jgi:hypothetical protein